MAVDVLIIDDDAEHRGLIEGALSTLGCRCDGAATAAEAIRKAGASKPRLVITEVRLPDGNGFELCRRLKEDPTLAGVRVIIVTGTYHKDKERLRDPQHGPDAYLPKPFRLPDLIGTAQHFLKPS